MTSLLALVAVQAPLLTLLALGSHRENEPAVINIVTGILITATPSSVELVLDVIGSPTASFTSLLTLWIGVASILHGLGMLGFYDSLGWWDHLTHTVSAALATALLYAALLVGVGPAPDGRTWALAAATLAVILALGLLWEAAELVMREIGDRFGIEPVLVHYGRRDTALDLLFDLGGAAVVLALDLRLFVSVFETLATAL